MLEEISNVTPEYDKKLSEELRLAYQALLNNVLISNKLLAQETEEDDILSLLLSITRLIIDFEAGAVFRLESGKYHQVSAMDIEEKFELTRNNYLNEGIYNWAASQKRILVMPEGENNTHILVPMITEKADIGILDLQVPVDASLLRNQDLDLLGVVVANASSRCEQIKLNRWSGLVDILLNTLETVNASEQLDILFNSILKGLDQLLHCTKYLLLITKGAETSIKAKYDEGKSYCISLAYKGKNHCYFVEKAINEQRGLRIPSYNEAVECENCPFINNRTKQDSYLMIVPLVIKNAVCGAVTIIDKSYNSKLFTEDSQHIVEIFANQVAIAIYQAQLREELQRNNAKFNKEIKMAGIVQRSLLPVIKSEKGISCGGNAHLHIENEEYIVTGYYMPCTTLGGDFYDIIDSDDRLHLTIADVSGHGLSSSLITALFKMALHKFITIDSSMPDQICHQLNSDLCKFIKTGDYITSFLGSMDKKTKEFRFSSAGHPYPLYYSASTHYVKLLSANGLPFAMMENQDYPQGSIILHSGDKLLLYTDGITEAINPNMQMYKKERLIESVIKHSDLMSCDFIAKINEDTQIFTESTTFHDDISLLLLEMK